MFLNQTRSIFLQEDSQKVKYVHPDLPQTGKTQTDFFVHCHVGMLTLVFSATVIHSPHANWCENDASCIVSTQKYQQNSRYTQLHTIYLPLRFHMKNVAITHTHTHTHTLWIVILFLSFEIPWRLKITDEIPKTNAVLH